VHALKEINFMIPFKVFGEAMQSQKMAYAYGKQDKPDATGFSII